MPADQHDEARETARLFKAQIQQKIHNLLDEFAMGKISRQQFHILYERYSNRLALAEEALAHGDIGSVEVDPSAPSTLDIRVKTAGKAQGMVVYHNFSGDVLETLGYFSVPVSEFINILHDITAQMKRGKMIEARLDQFDEKRWLLFLSNHYTTVVTEFVHEPSRQQIRTIERLHNDFEEANRVHIAAETVDSERLAYPFLAFVQKKIND